MVVTKRSLRGRRCNGESFIRYPQYMFFSILLILGGEGAQSFVDPAISSEIWNVPNSPTRFCQVDAFDCQRRLWGPGRRRPHNNWCKCSSSIRLGQATTDRVEDETKMYNFWEGPITTRSFNMDLQNLAMEDAQKAQDALEIMEELYEAHYGDGTSAHDLTLSSPLYVKPNAACYTTCMDGWIHSGDPDAADRAQVLLDRMERRFDKSGDDSIRPNTVSYMLVCQGWAETLNDELTGASAMRAESVLNRMKQRGMFPNAKLYTMALTAWCKRAGRVRGAMEQAERILAEMEQSSEHETSDPERSIRPNVVTYTSVIGGLARCKERDLATRAHAILDRMEKHGVEADMVAYTSVLNAWSRARSRKERAVAAKRATAILSKMEKLYEDDQYHVKPNLITYSTAINAIGNSLDPDAPNMVEVLLQHMYELHESGTITGIRPTTATYNAVITALARNRARPSGPNARRAEQLLFEMARRERNGEKNVIPNVRTWGGVLLAWAQSGTPDAAEQAQRVLDRMEQLQDKGESNVKPNYVCFTQVLGAWTKSRRPDALEKAEALLMRMEAEFEATGDTEVRPNTISYVQFIDGLIRRKAPGAAEWAQKTVDRMVRLYAKGLGHIRPSRIVFNTLINAWSRSEATDAPQKAEEILQWMESQYRNRADEYVKPDEVTFCGVLNAWANQAKSGGAQRAQQILDHMESLTPSQRGFHSTVISHNIVIKAWARSEEPDAIERSERILVRLEERGDPKPDTTTYSSVINCCAYYAGQSDGMQHAFDVAMRTFRKLRKSKDDQTNHVTYGTLLKAVSKLVESQDQRDSLIRKVFAQACSDGQVEAFVVSQVRNGSSAGVFRELVLRPIGLANAKSGRSIHALLQKIPPAWCRNVID